MAVSGPTKQCPRCNTLLPADATFCGTCGLHLTSSPPPAGAGGFQTTTGFAPAAPPGWPQGQAGFPPPGQAGFTPQGQPGAPIAPVAVAPAKRSKTWLIVTLLVIVVLLAGGVTAGFFFLRQGSSPLTQNPSSPIFDRHGLPESVPLPNGVTFKQKQSEERTLTGTEVRVQADEWLWTVASPNTPEKVQQFYLEQLPGKGWPNPHTETGSSGEKDVIACQGQQILLVAAGTKLQGNDEQGNPTITVTAPPGGSALGIALLTSNNQLVTALLCNGPQGNPTP